MFSIRINLICCILIFPIACFSLKNEVLHLPLHASEITLDPANIQDVSSLLVSRQINCQLMRLESADLVMEAAQSVKYLTQKRILITLKPDIRFNDGSKVTSGDVIASFEYLKKSRLVFSNMFSWIKKIEKISNNEIVIETKYYYPQFLNMLAVSSYPVYKATFLHRAQTNKALWSYPISCGKYKIIKNNSSKIILKPLYGQYPVEFSFVKKNEISGDDLKKYDISDLIFTGKPTESYQEIKTFDPYHIYLSINTHKKKWQDRKKRCAFMSRLDIKSIVQFYEGDALPATDLLPPGVFGYANSIDHISKINNMYKNNPILKADKFCLAFLTVSIPLKYQVKYFDMIKNFYPNVQARQIENSGHFGRQFIESRCDVFISGSKYNTLDAYGFLDAFTETDSNSTGFSNKKIANEIKSSQSISDPMKRFEQYRKIILELEDECLVFPILDIPYRKIYIKKNLNAPGIGMVPLDEYYLGNVKKIEKVD